MEEKRRKRESEICGFRRIGEDNAGSSVVHRTVEQAIYVVRLHRALLERKLMKTGVYRSQHQILMDVARWPRASQKDIAMHHHVSTAAIAVSLKKLEKGGYIVRQADKKDNRFNTITITEKGRSVVEESARIFQDVEQTIFQGFSQEEIEQLGRCMERMKQNLLTAVLEAKSGKREER